jgi:hypothetical protein
MPRPGPAARKRRRPLIDWARRYFMDEPRPAHNDHESWQLMEMRYVPRAGGYEEDLWRQHWEEIVEEFSRLQPGARPHKWWKYTAPKMSEADLVRIPANSTSDSN